MAQTSVVFLIDINGILRDQEDSLTNTVVIKTESQSDDGTNTQNESMELLPFGGLPQKSGDGLDWIKEFVLLTLFREANTGTEYDFSRVQWSFKFFDTSRHVDFRDGRSFVPFDNESFENFEKQLNLRMKPSTAAADQTADTSSLIGSSSSNIQFLSDAIKVITGGLPWSDGQCFNMSMSRSFNAEEPTTTVRNMVFAFMRVPRTDRELSEFSEFQRNNSTKDFMGMLLPSAFSYTFHHKLKIQLNFVDMRTAAENNTGFDSTRCYPRQIVRSLQYLGGGNVLSAPDTTTLTRGTMMFGLLPYPTYLRSQLKCSSLPNENLPSHIKRLAPTMTKVVQKTSPEFDNSSATLSRSLIRSGPPSVLEASFHNQSKVLRPFRLGHEEEQRLEYHRQKMADIKAKERLREGERKRKRIEVEPEDHYSKYERRGMDRLNDGYDSLDDSESEKEQRLENWIKDGVFNNTKRKRHTMDSTTMLKPPPSKNLHVFHEPAPKLPGSRGKKMLANVERQKLKVHAVESKRRSSEGVDIKQATQEQEKELRQIKRRLMIFLGGDSEHDSQDDPLDWMNTLKKELKTFIDITLQEDEPCLVALAQALVNSVFNSCTQRRVNSLRSATRKSYTAKKLSEEILLIAFPILNKRIINAHEPSGDSPSTSAAIQNQKLQQIIAFRETELQIILRLEIAWCFAEPDEDAMEVLLNEIHRLLQIVSAYRSHPPIDRFVNKILFPFYSQSTRFMRGLYKKMNIPLPAQLAIDGSPLANNRREDDSSMISSTSSINLCPEDSASQLHMHKPKRHRPSPTTVRRSEHITTSKGKGGSGSKKVRRQILVATSNPKLRTTSHFVPDRTLSLKKAVGAGGHKVSPKRVRRNLFDVQKKDKKDSKILLALGSSSRLTKSPVFKSPKGKSSPSGFFRAARSRRQLVMGSQPSDNNFGSPSANPHTEVLCPESPVTPGGDMRSSVSRYTSLTGSTERPRIIQESPEVHKNGFENRPMTRVASLSFYSTANTSKSRAWEKSEAKLMAARIKDSVDLRAKENLSLSDLELQQSPEGKFSRRTADESTHTVESTHLSFCEDSILGRQSPLPSNDDQSLEQITGPAPDLNNPNIEALITSQAFPLRVKENEIYLDVSQRDPSNCSPTISIIASPSTLQTPSKRVQFNLNENLINTPVSAKRTGSVTPKSILKETHEGS